MNGKNTLRLPSSHHSSTWRLGELLRKLKLSSYKIETYSSRDVDKVFYDLYPGWRKAFDEYGDAGQ